LSGIPWTGDWRSAAGIDEDGVFEPLGEREVIAKMLELYTNLQTVAASLRERLAKDESGQTMAEYGVVLGVITVLCIVAFTALSGAISGAIDSVTAILP
jgi:pilus assembly protein Flp/PilA